MSIPRIENPSIQPIISKLPPAKSVPSPDSSGGPLNFIKTRNPTNNKAISQTAKVVPPKSEPTIKPMNPHTKGILRTVRNDIFIKTKRYTAP